MTLSDLARQLGPDGWLLVNRAIADGVLVARLVDGHLVLDQADVEAWAERYRLNRPGMPPTSAPAGAGPPRHRG